ncbi:hypothetical protein AU255_18435 [Methyloprofundus sedimenti]|uniref:Uncharacterized protein n=1 Tax=Methyloprofundus sedimenti TaxID=1420851 RepID=A0A1V8M1L1_9GAMM|nr:hypothetical protein [Methyloprofundus sedimenti]OQK15447.1 hypothetical protein AU255_18435 [Methyloprofundus sedimenti]
MAKKKQQVERIENKLKKLSVGEIEQAVEKAIADLVGDEYHVNIKKLDFNFDNLGFGGDSCSLHLSIENYSDFDDDIPF